MKWKNLRREETEEHLRSKIREAIAPMRSKLTRTQGFYTGQSQLTKAKVLIVAIVACWVGFQQAHAQPRLPIQPLSQSVSQGANVTFVVSATGVAPLSYQWHFNEAAITGAAKRTLILTNVQPVDAGGYSVVVTNIAGSVTSLVARLDVDLTFTVITSGPIFTDIGPSAGAAWRDYDNDGFPDLLVGNISIPDFLYHNRGDGTFERALTTVIGGLGLGSGTWGDYDNDGFSDLYTFSGRDLGVGLFHNQGNGTLLRLTNASIIGPIIGDHTFSGSVAWGDYDNDGFVDMIVANGTFGGDLKNFLFHNQGNGSFSKVTTGSIAVDLHESWTGAWADYDDDGWLDLLVTSNGGFTSSGLGEDNQFFHNDGPAGFRKLTAAQLGLPPHDGGYSRGAAWGDYDNDGRLDLFVAGRTNLLYHNIGEGKFKKITTGEIVTDSTVNESIGCTWVDYDNDGYLDLLVVNVTDNNFLYHNNGNGTFTKITSGSLVNDGVAFASIDAAWADYDNDGFMDVVLVGDHGGNNVLFHNNGNTNHWINLKLVGTASNRGAIGAKVRVQATIGGKNFWQRRDIGASGSQAGQSDIRANFGLGDATNIDTVRIEWPSGTVQELHNLGSNQFLTVTEPARLKGGLSGGQFQLVLNGGVGFRYELQSSPNLMDWTSLANVMTTNMTMPVLTLDAAQVSQNYFRALRQ